MKTLVNPFIQSGALPIDRAIVDNVRTSRIFSPLITEGGSLGVYGERGMGKSSFLNYIAHPPADWYKDHFQNYIFVLFNCADIVNPLTTNNFWLQSVNHLNHNIGAGPVKEKCQVLLKRNEEGKDLGSNNFHEILDVAAGARMRIVLLLDDFDILILTDKDHLETTRNFLQGLRSLTTRDTNKANLVVATRCSLEELCKPVTALGISPFSNGFTLYRLQMFRESEMTRLLQWVEKAGQPAFSYKESQYICYLSGHHPQLAQLAASIVFDKRLEAGSPLDDLTIVGESFKSEARHIFESLWMATSDIEQTLLMLIALQKLEGKIPKCQYDLTDLPIILSQRERELIELTNRGLLIRTQANPPLWDIFSPVFGWWVLKEIESSGPEHLSERLKVWGNLLTKKQVNKLEQLVNVARENINIIETFGKAVIQLIPY